MKELNKPIFSVDHDFYFAGFIRESIKKFFTGKFSFILDSAMFLFFWSKMFL